MLNFEKPIRFIYRTEKQIYKVVSFNNLINEVTVLPINETDETKIETFSQSEFENVELYEIRNSAEDTSYHDCYLNQKEVTLIESIFNGLNNDAPTYAPYISIMKKT